jgi:DNA-binding response OmpR family regulator
VHSVTAEDAPASEGLTLHATIVAAVVSPQIHTLAEDLRREALQIDVSSADVMREVAQPRIYVFSFDAALAVVLAERIVEWGRGRAGLIGVVPDGSSSERETLLAAGFDDVVAGKLSTRELCARIRAVHRRIHWPGLRNGRLRFGSFTLDVMNRTLWTQGKTITLTSTELEVMRALMVARGRPLSRTDLLDAVWGGGDLEVTERAVDNVILRLRRKLPVPDALETVRGVGFRLA